MPFCDGGIHYTLLHTQYVIFNNNFHLTVVSYIENDEIPNEKPASERYED